MVVRGVVKRAVLLRERGHQLLFCCCGCDAAASVATQTFTNGTLLRCFLYPGYPGMHNKQLAHKQDQPPKRLTFSACVTVLAIRHPEFLTRHSF
jgi:hypothetical protein